MKILKISFKFTVLLITLSVLSYAAKPHATPFNTVTITDAVFPIHVEAEISTTPTREEFTIGLIQKYAAQYKVSSHEMYETIKCESAETFDPTLQSREKDKYGNQEKSFGLAQIHLIDHPDVTLQQAEDPEFAVEFMAKGFASKHKWWWSCYTSLKKRGVL